MPRGAYPSAPVSRSISPVVERCSGAWSRGAYPLARCRYPFAPVSRGAPVPGREGWIQKLGTGITSPCVEKGSGAWPRGAYPLAPATIPIRHGMCPGAWPRGAYQLAPVPISISPGVERYSQGRIQVNSSKVSAMSKLTGHSTNSHHRAPRLLERDPPGKGKPTSAVSPSRDQAAMTDAEAAAEPHILRPTAVVTLLQSNRARTADDARGARFFFLRLF